MELIQKILAYIVWFSSTYFIVLFLLLLLKYRDAMFKKHPKLKKWPSVSIIVPAYNEKKTILKTLISLTKISYPKNKLELIVINDGSTDDTAHVIDVFRKKHKIKFINNKKNKGKAAVLNQAIAQSRGEFVVCMDADTVVSSNILKTVLPDFTNNKIGAVTVSIDLKPQTFMQKVTEIEYALGLSLSLGVLCRLDSAHVTPGPFTMFRKSVLDELGGFDETNITEDLEIAYRIQKHGYKIKCCLLAKVFTIVPRGFKALYKQRRRWYTGALQTVSQHRDVIFNKERGIFGIFVPYTYAVIFLGAILFIVSSLLSLKNTYRNIMFYRFIDFNFFQMLKQIRIDLLSFFGIYGLLIVFSYLLTAILAYTGLKLLNKNIKSRFFGYIGFLPFFLLYQIFWISSIFNFVFRREFEWK